jgi:hypothetical protein
MMVKATANLNIHKHRNILIEKSDQNKKLIVGNISDQ